MSVNRVILVGNVGAKPTVKMAEGSMVATFPLATTEPAQTTANGAVIPALTEWHRLVVWGPTAEFTDRYVDKGCRLYVEGRLRTRVWQDTNALKHSVTEILVEKLEILQRPARQ